MCDENPEKLIYSCPSRIVNMGQNQPLDLEFRIPFLLCHITFYKLKALLGGGSAVPFCRDTSVCRMSFPCLRKSLLYGKTSSPYC